MGRTLPEPEDSWFDRPNLPNPTKGKGRKGRSTVREPLPSLILPLASMPFHAIIALLNLLAVFMPGGPITAVNVLFVCTSLFFVGLSYKMYRGTLVRRQEVREKNLDHWIQTELPELPARSPQLQAFEAGMAAQYRLTMAAQGKDEKGRWLRGRLNAS